MESCQSPPALPLGQTKVNIGIVIQQWLLLRELTGMEIDAMVAVFLLDSCVFWGGICTCSSV
uniref:Uncharacterized protein n=1 Tax=Sander lucioperca TaxID=283035 RepID=A0A8D0D1U7_SANLU